MSCRSWVGMQHLQPIKNVNPQHPLLFLCLQILHTVILWNTWRSLYDILERHCVCLKFMHQSRHQQWQDTRSTELGYEQLSAVGERYSTLSGKPVSTSSASSTITRYLQNAHNNNATTCWYPRLLLIQLLLYQQINQPVYSATLLFIENYSGLLQMHSIKSTSSIFNNFSQNIITRFPSHRFLSFFSPLNSTIITREKIKWFHDTLPPPPQLVLSQIIKNNSLFRYI